jgi:hypothetical protein
MGAIFATKFLRVVKFFELVSAELRLSGCYVNLSRTLIGQKDYVRAIFAR